MSKYYNVRSFLCAVLCAVILYNVQQLQSSDAAIVVSADVDVLEPTDFATLSGLEKALSSKSFGTMNDEQAGLLDQLIDLMRTKPEGQEEIQDLFAQLFGLSEQEQLEDLYDRASKEIAIVAELRAARDRARALHGESDSFALQEFAAEVSDQKAAEFLSNSYQGAHLYTTLTELYEGALPDVLERAFTAPERLGRDMYPAFDAVLSPVVGPLSGLGFEKADFELMMEPYGLLFKVLRAFSGTHRVDKLVNSLQALNEAQIAEDKNLYDDVINSGNYVQEIVHLALYRGLMTDMIDGLRAGDLARFVEGVEALVVRAGVGVEDSPAYHDLIMRTKEDLLVDFFKTIVARVGALNEGTISYKEHGFMFEPPHSIGWDQAERDARLKSAIARSALIKPLYDMIKSTQIDDVDIDEFLKLAKDKVWGSLFEMEVVDDVLRATWSREVTKPDDYEDLLIQERKRIQAVVLQYLKRQAIGIKILQEYV